MAGGRLIPRVDSHGREYADLMRVVGLTASDPVPVHPGLRGFLAAEWVPPTLHVVEHAQTFSRAREERRRG